MNARKTMTKIWICIGAQPSLEMAASAAIDPAAAQQYLDIQLRHAQDHLEQRLAEAGGKEIFHAT